MTDEKSRQLVTFNIDTLSTACGVEMAQDSNPSYWAEYTNLQHLKHALIREYLNGWFPKLGFWSGRIVYLDTHAGRGRHAAGQTGSPVMAIETLLSHTYRDRILQKSEVMFFLIEHDPQNVELLRAEVAALGNIPKRIQVHISVVTIALRRWKEFSPTLKKKEKESLRRLYLLILTVSKCRAISFDGS
jgi:three-Cys-motif partner protein